MVWFKFKMINKKMSYAWSLPSFDDKSHVKICLCGASPILVYGGASCESSPSEAQSRKVVRLEEMKIVFIDLKWFKCARQRYDLDRVSILPVS